MSKSLKRVINALSTHGIDAEIREMADETKTAVQAANALGCDVDQIAKSVIFADASNPQELFLFITAGSNRVDPEKSARHAGRGLAQADGSAIRRITGFAIGGVSPVGHVTPINAFLDSRLLEFDLVWAAAGTPRHVFSIKPVVLKIISRAQIIDFTVLKK